MIVRNGALLAILIGAIQFLQLPEGLFLVLAVLTVLEPSLGGGAIAGRERLLGSVVGLLAVVIASGALQLAPQPLQVFSGLTLVRLFGFASGLSSGYVVGGHMVAGSLLHDTSHWWHYAFWRTVMTLLGVMIGVWVSLHIYSQRAISTWETSCNRWLLELARSLENLNGIPDAPPVFETLRQHRNNLRQDLPQLAAEQSVLEARNSRALLHAQKVLQHGSTVMSCSRDLALRFLAHERDTPWIAVLPVEQLVEHGAARLIQLAGGREAPQALQQLIQIRELLEGQITQRLHQAGEPMGGDQSLFIASRLLLLSDGLIQIGGHNSQEPFAATRHSPGQQAG